MLSGLNKALAHIECSLSSEDPLALIEEVSGIPVVHLKAVFQVLTGMSLVEYIRRRRLSCAASDLANGERVTDVAFRYGYDSVDGFTRAYKRWAQCTPSETSRTKCVQVFSPVSFCVSIKGGTPMDFRIVEMPSFSFAGKSARVPLQFEGVNKAIVDLAESITFEQREEMHRLQDVDPLQVVNVSWDADAGFEEESGEVSHMIGVLTSAKKVGCGLDLLSIPAGTWAVFPCEGPFPNTMQNITARIYSEWLISDNWALRDSLMFSFTRYDSEEVDSLYSEVWIPVSHLKQ